MASTDNYTRMQNAHIMLKMLANAIHGQEVDVETCPNLECRSVRVVWTLLKELYQDNTGVEYQESTAQNEH